MSTKHPSTKEFYLNDYSMNTQQQLMMVYSDRKLLGQLVAITKDKLETHLSFYDVAILINGGSVTLNKRRKVWL